MKISRPINAVMVFCCLLIWGIWGCSSEKAQKDNAGKVEDPSFMSIGSFAVFKQDDGTTRVRDGAGRYLLLVPRGMPVPDGADPMSVVRTPVQRIVAYRYFDVSILKALGVLEQTLVGVTKKKEEWLIPQVARGMEEGRITFLGTSSALDFEKLHQIRPDLVLTWDMSIIPMLEEMKIPCAITTTPVAMCLSARMKFVRFLAPFFNKEKEAEHYFEKIALALNQIRKNTARAGRKPKVMWGDVYEKRVLVEPGNSWVGELVELALSDYQFEDVFGRACIEISLERFLYSGKDADIFFTYRTPETGATSKAALCRANPLLAGIKPLKDGRVFSPLSHYAQSGDKLDEILIDVAAILHPELYPGYQMKYFRELPDQDPEVSQNNNQKGSLR